MPNEWEERLLYADGVTKPMIIQLAPAKTKSYSKERCSSMVERYSLHARIKQPECRWWFDSTHRSQIQNLTNMEKTKPRRGEIKSRFLEMKVGETIFFPFSEYNPNTIRSTPSSTLLKEVSEGKKWITKTDPFGKRVAVTRVL